MGGVVDFVFLVDATGSMAPCMDALKTNVGIFIDELEGPQSSVRNWRGKVIAFRDVPADGKDWWHEEPFVSDSEMLRDQLGRLEAHGGGDEPESLLDALHRVARSESSERGAQTLDPYKWRYRSDAARVVIVFTDATYHPVMSYPEGAGGTVADVQNAVMTGRIILIMYAPNHPCYEELAKIDKAEWEAIPADPDYVQGLVKYTGDKTNFQKALLALAKSVSMSAEIVAL